MSEVLKIWSFCVKGCRHIGEPQNWGALELRSLGIGGVADTRNSSTCVTTSNLIVLQAPTSATKGERTNRREPPKLGSAGFQPLWGGTVADP